MDSVAIASRIVVALEQLRVPYMITGALALNAYALPRSTSDADFVVQWVPHSIEDLVGLVQDEFAFDRQMGFETITSTTRWHLAFRGTPFTVELFDLTDDPHHQARFQRRVRGAFGHVKAWFPTAEDVLIQKLRWSVKARRAKDAADAVTLIASQHDQLDWAYIEPWCHAHGTKDLLAQLRRQAEELL